ncbi:MAG: TIM-barrel domain-containing protein [Rikenellaceae bacterium]
MKKRLILFIALAALAVGCQSNFVYEVEKSDNGVSILKDDMIIKITVVDEDIVRVTKELADFSVPEIPDYVGLLDPQDVKWKLKESSNKVVITTDEIKVIVDKDGVIEYQTPSGKSYVAESADMTYINKERVDGNKLSQSFTVGDEALYGLGQYQSGIMNWKHVPVRLEQFNQEVAVPFVISTKNYGIYWNNYSVTDFNQAHNEIEFTADAVITTATTAADVSTVAASSPTTHTEVENVIQAKSKIKDPTNVRETTFTPSKSGLYTFFVESAKANRMRGNIRLVIDGDPVINYNTVWVPTTYSGVKELEAGKEYKVEFENSGTKIAGRVFYNEPDYGMTAFTSFGGYKIDYFIMVGDSPKDVLALNHKLTGKTPMFSRKTYGFWQCRERYHNQAELLENAREMRERKIPVDMIVQDWFYWPNKTKGCEWDRAKYPDPEAMAKEVNSLNMNLMVSVWPEIINDPMLEKYDLKDKKLGGINHLDFYDDTVGDKYYRMLSDSMFHIGVNSIWLDGTEPNRKPKDSFVTGVGLPFLDVTNPYSLLVTKAMYEGKRKEYPTERVVNLARSGFTGQQKYGNVVWSGDVAGTWEQFEEQISAGLNFTMSGLPYWSHDIGGFFRDSKSMNPIYDDQYTNPEYKELLARWFQFGAFSPIFRIHGYVSQTEIWRYDEAFEAMARKFIDLRYTLLPYIYSEAWKITSEGSTLMSPLVYHYPEDKATWAVKDQLFFGENMMVCFATQYEQRQKEIYLPKGEWYDFWTGEKMAACGRVVVDTPYDSTPIYIKAGAIMPIGPKLQYADEPNDEPLLIKVYPGADGEYTLYFDDNFTNDYESGAYSEVEFEYSHSDGTLSIEKGDGDYIDFKRNPMIFKVEKVGGKGSQTVVFNGEKKDIKL